MKARAIAASTAWIATFAFAAAACGGRVDGGDLGAFSASGTPGGAIDPAPRRPPGGGKGRPPVAPLTNAAAASMIAEDYCKAFSSCCFSVGQPPIDVARCRELASAAVQKQLDAGGATESSAADVAVCISAIHTRIAACGKEDARFSGDFPLFQPALPAHACIPLLPKVPVFSYEACSASSPCAEPDATCAIDACASSQPVGATCMQDDGCVDTANCVSGKCVPSSTADVGAACSTNVDCRLGLVCFDGACAPTRDHPELATHRSSPYRIGADTCRAFTYL